jgi:hypothetical protein
VYHCKFVLCVSLCLYVWIQKGQKYSVSSGQWCVSKAWPSARSGWLQNRPCGKQKGITDNILNKFGTRLRLFFKRLFLCPPRRTKEALHSSGALLPRLALAAAPASLNRHQSEATTETPATPPKLAILRQSAPQVAQFLLPSSPAPGRWRCNQKKEKYLVF